MESLENKQISTVEKSHTNIYCQQEEKKHPEEEQKEKKVVYYKWDEEMTSQAEDILNKEKNQMAELMYEKLEKDAKRNWDIFYKNNKTNFYKDRHYIKFEFSELSDRITKLDYEKDESTKLRLLDVGCGVGNGFYPLYREFKHRLIVNCCDFSPRAVNFVKEHELYNPEHIDAKVCDIVNHEIPFTPNTADYGIMLFVLSAISPENFHKTAKKIYEQMNENGILYFRDYGKYDLAQLRLAQRGNQKLKDNFYIRSDKTRAYYFTTEEVRDIFESAGFSTIENEYHYRLIENRKDQKKMHRVWIQAKFVRSQKQEQIAVVNINYQEQEESKNTDNQQEEQF